MPLVVRREEFAAVKRTLAAVERELIANEQALDKLEPLLDQAEKLVEAKTGYRLRPPSIAGNTSAFGPSPSSE